MPANASACLALPTLDGLFNPKAAGRAPIALDHIAASLEAPIFRFIAAILFTCPSTRFTVQHWLDDDERASEDDYEGISCPICTGVHFVNRKGKVLGGEED